jgi:multiple sugar transport system ATP-binding protein
MAGIRIDSVRKTFGKVDAVAGVSLDIPDGAFVILVGPSGCGKTTLLRLLAGLEEVTSGHLFIGDAEVTETPARDRDIAMVFQSYALYPHMNVRRNLSFALELRKIAQEEIDRRVGLAADILGISHLLDRRPKQLSGGQRQRVALGRAIVREPAAFLFDEPLSNLDAKLRSSMRSELIKLHKRLGTTIVYVTHDQVEAMTMGELVVVMKDGVIQQQGAPLEIYNNPVNLFVAEFIGSPAMNFLRGTAEGGRVMAPGGLSLPLPREVPAEADFVVGLRPEHLAVEPQAGFQPLDSRVEVVEPLGAETIVEISVASATSSAATLTARIRGETVPAVGSALRFHIDPARLYLFDRKTGDRLAR